LSPGPDPTINGLRFVVTAGGTREPIDPVRFIGNRSSGKMGNELAAAAVRQGASVTLVTAAAAPAEQPGLEVVMVETAAEMHAAVRNSLPGTRVLIMAAAVADWRPREAARNKLKKGADTLTLELVPTVDILRDIAKGTGPDKALLALGYAGWAPGQLESEIQANGWLHCAADTELIFDPEVDRKYSRAFGKIGIDPLRLVNDAGHA